MNETMKSNKLLQTGLVLLGITMTIYGMLYTIGGFLDNNIGIISTLLWIIVMGFGVKLYNTSHNKSYISSKYYKKAYDNNIIFFNKHIFKIKIGIIILILLFMIPVIYWPHNMDMGNEPNQTIYWNETTTDLTQLRMEMPYMIVHNYKLISLFIISTLWFGIKYLELWLRDERRKVYDI